MLSSGAAKKVTIYLNEDTAAPHGPLHQAIVQFLVSKSVAGATVYRGILGYGAKGHTHKQSFFHLSRDLPVMIAVVDSAEKLDRAAAEVERMMSDGLIVRSAVEMVRVIHAPG